MIGSEVDNAGEGVLMLRHFKSCQRENKENRLQDPEALWLLQPKHQEVIHLVPLDQVIVLFQ
jgi:hypothetical protein